MFFCDFLSYFLHEEAALFYICFDVVIVVNTKYNFKAKTHHKRQQGQISCEFE